MRLGLRLKNERGATLVEQAFVLPVFLVFLVISLDLLRVTYAALTTQFVASRVIREAIVGPVKFNVAPYNLEDSPYEAFIANEISRMAGFFRVDIRPEDVIVVCRAAAGCADDAGQPGALVAVEVRLPSPVTLFRTLNLRGNVVARNELWEPVL